MKGKRAISEICNERLNLARVLELKEGVLDYESFLKEANRCVSTEGVVLTTKNTISQILDAIMGPLPYTGASKKFRLLREMVQRGDFSKKEITCDQSPPFSPSPDQRNELGEYNQPILQRMDDFGQSYEESPPDELGAELGAENDLLLDTITECELERMEDELAQYGLTDGEFLDIINSIEAENDALNDLNMFANTDSEMCDVGAECGENDADYAGASCNKPGGASSLLDATESWAHAREEGPLDRYGPVTASVDSLGIDGLSLGNLNELKVTKGVKPRLQRQHGVIEGPCDFE